MESREDLVFIAQLNENAERYEDMIETMKKIISLGEELNDKERNLLSVAYKNIIGPRRAAWRIVSTIETREKGRTKPSSARIEYVTGYRVKIEEELKAYCNDVLSLIDNKFIPTCTETTAKVFYYKMKGDYFRYLAEFTQKDDRKAHANQSLEAYKAATQIAEQLNPTDPIRLGLALNYSVFYYEIMNDSEKACELARTAFDAAINDLDKLSQDAYKDATLIMQLLRDNLNLWINEDHVEGNEEENQ
ncbi:14-3-3 protein [Spironucleus salmonicida]|uniref:14-3-3 protein n=1 Tax=Spironucleus salmonicida TaxID=348837 RepID=V6LZI4_9EUKA|nr:14-3-3 protein [Spironucleus salmonicida]|eukprot:EST46244.1 14-3-3 protein [Spironucleus salmonicida]